MRATQFYVLPYTSRLKKDPVARRTLTLRSFLRKVDAALPDEYIDFLNRGGPDELDWEVLYPEQWKTAVS
ncbi:hypothetical protein SAMN04488512_12627 [Sulfitobacter litoralis]|jgi:DNA (cytosine-5)-methyltransferase 1|uniref:Uncharacterized protein n=1 Tax=Sulfitobacter litoralis TaxID=335975 RepID=A0ABY0SWC4_9RHOB|nr:hypothetical protein SAMN04488512_12627 [Sulfitobacter litoralis]|tara:strand:- start:9383 stop:9592 length:210 start_codon:yes stop_codon:yes gene_type:complete